MKQESHNNKTFFFLLIINSSLLVSAIVGISAVISNTYRLLIVRHDRQSMPRGGWTPTSQNKTRKVWITHALLQDFRGERESLPKESFRATRIPRPKLFLKTEQSWEEILEEFRSQGLTFLRVGEWAQKRTPFIFPRAWVVLKEYVGNQHPHPPLLRTHPLYTPVHPWTLFCWTLAYV